jgi:hypothetical protein
MDTRTAAPQRGLAAGGALNDFPFERGRFRGRFEAMSEKLKHRMEEIDKDLAHSWIELSDRVRDLSAALKVKAAGTALAADADHLAQEADHLCGHVERIHADVNDLVAKLEIQIPLLEPDVPASPKSELTEMEWARIQRENHELRGDFKDVLKALFMWRDDPADRVGK